MLILNIYTYNLCLKVFKLKVFYNKTNTIQLNNKIEYTGMYLQLEITLISILRPSYNFNCKPYVFNN